MELFKNLFKRKKVSIVQKKKTVIVVILDESGSMNAKKYDILRGFNGFIFEQKLIQNDSARLYFVKFNTDVKVVHKGIPLEEVPDLTSYGYTPRGGTALYDAIAEGVRTADKDKTSDERVICVIITDGEENSSRETTKEQVKNIISSYEAKGDWTFLYIGENPEQWTRDAGMSACNAIQLNHKEPYLSLSQTGSSISTYRTSMASQDRQLFHK